MATETFNYLIHGLPVITTMRFDGISEVEQRSSLEPVVVELGDVPDRLDAPLLEDSYRQVTDGTYLREFPGVARLLVVGGRRITVQPAPGCEPGLLHNIITTIGLSMAGFQRGYLPLHASTVVVDGAAVAFAGPSGAGKSTLATALAGRRGFAWLGDDLCLARPAAEGIRVGRGLPYLRLCDDSVQFVGPANLEFVGERREDGKRGFRPISIDRTNDFPLRRLYFPRAVGPHELSRITRIDPVHALKPVIESLRLSTPFLSIGAVRRSFERVVQLTNGLEFYWFDRPWALSGFDAALDVLERHLGRASGGAPKSSSSNAFVPGEESR